MKGKIIRLVTTPAYYVNGEPHLGHIYSNLLANRIAEKLNLPLLSGSDVHGRKMRYFFLEKGMESPFSQWLPLLILPFKRSISNLSSQPLIYRHSDQSDHENFVKRCWIFLREKGIIIESFYEGFYIRTEEKFSKNWEEGSEKISSPEYFLNLKPFVTRIKRLYERGKIKVFPHIFLSKIFEFIDSIDSLCVSRKEKWGIKVPAGGKILDRTVHVWFDALLYYLSWDKDLDSPRIFHQVIGKDILLFHSWYWPVILMALEFDFELNLYVTGWVLSGEEKLSKSLIKEQAFPLLDLNNKELLEQLLLNHKIGRDIKIQGEDIQKANFEIRNLKNLLTRILSLASSKGIKVFPFNTAVNFKGRCLNKLIQITAPWKKNREVFLIYLLSWSYVLVLKEGALRSFRPCFITFGKSVLFMKLLFLAKARW